MIKDILELSKISDYLVKRNLLKQYLKAKIYILEWKEKLVDLRYREPKELGVIYFKINKKFRAWARKDWKYFNYFFVSKLSTTSVSIL